MNTKYYSILMQWSADKVIVYIELPVRISSVLISRNI